MTIYTQTFSIYHVRLFRTMLLCGLGTLLTGAKDFDIGIVGWPAIVLEGEVPPDHLGDDPIVGRLVCPPVSRVALDAERSDPLLIRDVDVKSVGDRHVWTYEMRTGLFWWNGDPVTGGDLARYMEKHLPVIAKQRSLGENVPAYKIQTEGMQVSVAWESKPSFGPYIFNGFSLWRKRTEKHDAIDYECVGLYAPKKVGKGYSLKPTPGYGPGRKSILLSPEATKKTVKQLMRFRTAGTFGSTPWTRLSDTRLTCDLTLETPVFTVIVWNTEASPTSDPEFRKILTNLTPRGALVRSGAGYLGTLVSAPIPRSHPGYKKSLSVREFDLVRASKALTKMGFKRDTPSSPRLTPKGEPLVLKIQTSSEKDGLLEKVLADSFASVGIGVEYVRTKPGFPHVNGVLTGMEVDWPRVDFYPYLAGMDSPQYPLFPLKDKDLDQAMLAYARTLADPKPDFKKLQTVHQRLFDLEPFTVLLQHETCLETDGLASKVKQIDILDPDWFRGFVR